MRLLWRREGAFPDAGAAATVEPNCDVRCDSAVRFTSTPAVGCAQIAVITVGDQTMARD
jgi:hypothetical protein